MAKYAIVVMSEHSEGNPDSIHEEMNRCPTT
jgi:hypothetical protein